MDGWGETRLFFRQMPRSGIAPIALRRTLGKIGQRPAPAGRYRMIIESPCAGNFLQPILNAMNGQALQQRTSFLWDKLGEQVLSPLVNMVDDPLQPGTRGASLFDYDGVATCRRELFTEGRLQTYFIDTPMGRKLGMQPTTQGIHRLIMAPTSDASASPLEGKKDTSPAILVTDFNHGQHARCVAAPESRSQRCRPLGDGAHPHAHLRGCRLQRLLNPASSRYSVTVSDGTGQ